MRETNRTLRRAESRELDPRTALPYARHVDDHALALDTGALAISLRLDGASFETSDPGELNGRLNKLNLAWRNLADERLAVWTHVVRREDGVWPAGHFTSDFARGLDAAYRQSMAGQRLFTNELYLTLVLHPGTGPHDRLSQTISRLRRPTDDVKTRLQRLHETCRDTIQHLGRYQPRVLGLYQHRGAWFSEPLEMLRLLLTGQAERVPLVAGHLSQAVYTARLIFGREVLEIREAGATRFAAMLGIKEYPAVTRPGLWDDLLKARFPLVASQSFAFLSKSAARGVMERKQNQFVSARDRAASQVAGLASALDDLTSNRFVMGDHQASVLVHSASLEDLPEAMSRARAILADSGLVAAREDLGLEGAFWAQFPGNFSRRPRPAAVTSRNFAALSPFHTYPTGKAEGNHWGPAVALMRTSAGSPFYFNFHVADLGHTFICGPSGSGKTVIQNFLLAQLEKLGATQVFLDKDRGAEIFVRASGGTYLPLHNGAPTGFAPLKALASTPANIAFLSQFVRSLVTLPGERLTPSAQRAIDDAVAALMPMPAAERSLMALRVMLGQRDAGGVGARLERWCRGGPLGWVLDNETDLVGLDGRLVGFDLTEILDIPEVRQAVTGYLFHRIAALVDGRRFVLDIDEFWKVLGDEAFKDLTQDALKTWRKRDAFLVLGTQSPADVLKSPIAHTLVEMCATKIFLPNPSAMARDYCEGFGLSDQEFRLVRDELSADQRRFLVKQGHDSVVVSLDLSGLPDELAVLSGRSDTVELAERLRAHHGDHPAEWLTHFHQQRSR